MWVFSSARLERQTVNLDVGGSNPSRPVSLFCYEENLKRKKVLFILLISKKVALKLNKEYGIPFGEGGISTSKTKHKKYYLCTRAKNITALEKATK